MNIVCINTTHKGSTGNIMRQIAACARENGHQVTTFSTYGFWFSPKSLKMAKPEKLPELEGHRYYGSYLSSAVHVFGNALLGGNGCFSIFATLNLLRKIDVLKPDLIHLHNLHGCNINLPLLFRYIKKHHIRVVWTLHDCWAVTGHCAHFDMIECDKWKTHCHDCPQHRGYPASYIDNSRWMFGKKRKWFTGVEDMTIVTPSHWLADIVKHSFLKEYPVKVIHNGIDLSVFQPTPSDFRQRHHCEDKFVLLGVAVGWDERKGADVFVELAKRLDAERFRLIMVGTTPEMDEWLPKEIVSIHRTENQKELAEIYTAADLFLNPTREDTFPTTNIEAIACGTPVITFDTGGSPEAIDETCGIVVPKGDIDAMEKVIWHCMENWPFANEKCLLRTRQFNKDYKFEEYAYLYGKAQFM